MVSEEDQYKYSLPLDTAHYANVNFDTYIKETDLIKVVLIKNPVPENINLVKTLDDFVKGILKDKKKQKDVDFDNVLEKAQGRNRSVMGPLLKIWTAVESARLSQKDSVEVDLKEIQEFVEQTVLLLGQALNSISYYRIFGMLLALTNSPPQSKQMLKEDSELFQMNNKNLFGKKFRENIWDTSKSKKQTLKMLSNTSQTKWKPFRHGLPQTPRRRFGGQQQQNLLLRKGTTKVMDTDTVNINQETLFNTVQFPYAVPVEDLKHIHPYIKSLFCAREIPSVQVAGSLKNFIENWKILTNDTEILSLVEGYTIPFHEIPQQENIPNSPKLSQEERILVQKEIHKMLNKGAIVETQNYLEGEFFSNPFLVEKKDGGTDQ